MIPEPAITSAVNVESLPLLPLIYDPSFSFITSVWSFVYFCFSFRIDLVIPIYQCLLFDSNLIFFFTPGITATTMVGPWESVGCEWTSRWRWFTWCWLFTRFESISGFVDHSFPRNWLLPSSLFSFLASFAPSYSLHHIAVLLLILQNPRRLTVWRLAICMRLVFVCVCIPTPPQTGRLI